MQIAAIIFSLCLIVYSFSFRNDRQREVLIISADLTLKLHRDQCVSEAVAQ